jgi:hypothetical protein
VDTIFRRASARNWQFEELTRVIECDALEFRPPNEKMRLSVTFFTSKIYLSTTAQRKYTTATVK